jgi:hypothetical protein
MRHVVTRCTFATLLMVTTAGATFYASAASATPSSAAATRLLVTSLKDARAAKWVHEQIHVYEAGALIAVENDTLGPRSAQGSVTINGLSNSGTVQVIALPTQNEVYVNGTSGGLSALFPDMESPYEYANEWLELTPTDPDYVSVSTPNTLASTFALVRFSGKLTLGPVVVRRGQRVRAISGTIPIEGGTPATHGTLYVTATKKPLPFSLQESPGGIVEDLVWSNWKVGTTPTPPPSATPFPVSSTTSTSS